MTSFRRSMTMVLREAAVPNGETITQSSPSPKPAHSRAYLALHGFLTSLARPVNLLKLLDRVQAARGIFLQRSLRPIERSRTKGQQWKRSFFHYLFCFVIGIFISLTPFVSIDMPKHFVSKHKAFSFKEDPEAMNLHNNLVKNEVSLLDIMNENTSVGVLRPSDMNIDAVDSLYNSSSIQEPELVYQKLLIVVTTTYARPFQAYYLSRLAHTLRVIPPPLLWMVVEMSMQSMETAKILRGSGVMYRHLICEQNVTSIKDAYAHQRNVALSHIKKHQLDGIVFFADDNKMYSLDLFDQMRQIRRFGTWPVAFLSKGRKEVILEGPICNASQVVGWHTNPRWRTSRRFPVEMSGFAFNSTILWDPKRWHQSSSELVRHQDKLKQGFEESTFIEQLVEDESQMEGLPSNCSRIMVWHLFLESPELSYPKGWLMHKNLEIVVPLT